MDSPHASDWPPAGLTRAEAQARIAAEGYNELPVQKQRDLIAIVLEVLREPMFLLLVTASGIYLLFGDLREALVLLASIVVVMGITIYQSRKTESALEALRDLSSPRALVIRDGVEERIAGREVARGDVLLLKEGDRIAADALLFSANDLRVDESLLTGESVPVDKMAAASGAPVTVRPGGDGLPVVYAGTMIVQGQGSAVVIATGVHSEFGRIGRALQSIDATPTRLQRETATVVKRLAAGGLALCACVVLIYGFTRGDWLAGFLAGVTLAMAILPEEFPVVLTVFLALGAWRISRHGVLTRHMPAIETLGSATVLCVDKTGTLTLNRMSVRQLAARGEQRDLEAQPDEPLPEAMRKLVDVAMLASESNPVDPMERAIVALAQRAGGVVPSGDWTLVREYPLSAELLAHTHGWQTSPDANAFMVATKGAPEVVATLCHLDEAALRDVHRSLAAIGARIRFRMARIDRSCRSAAADRGRSSTRMPDGRYTGRDDYRRLSGDCARDRAAGRACRWRRHHRPSVARHDRR
mgnify:CR=1 FL=1